MPLIPDANFEYPRRFVRKDGTSHWHYWSFDRVYEVNRALIWPIKQGKDLNKYCLSQVGCTSKMEDEDYVEGVTANFLARIKKGCPMSFHPTVIIALRDWKNKPESAGLLAHEIYHLTSQVYSYAGVGADPSLHSANEHWAWYIDSVVREFTAALEWARRYDLKHGTTNHKQRRK